MRCVYSHVKTASWNVYMCVLACLGVGETHGPFICCSYRFLTLCDLHLVCVEKKIYWKEQHNCLKNYCHKLRSIVILNCSRTLWIKWIVKVLCHFREVQYFVKASSTKSFVETKKPVERGLKLCLAIDNKDIQLLALYFSVHKTIAWFFSDLQRACTVSFYLGPRL